MSAIDKHFSRWTEFDCRKAYREISAMRGALLAISQVASGEAQQIAINAIRETENAGNAHAA